MEKVKGWLLALAESFDAWRIIPRLMLFCYGYLVWSLFVWYKSIPQYVQTKCDGAILQILLEQGQTMAMARELACNIIGSTGGPTAEQTMFVTTIIGLSTGIFALYTTTGRQWQRQKEDKRGYDPRDNSVYDRYPRHDYGRNDNPYDRYPRHDYGRDTNDNPQYPRHDYGRDNRNNNKY